MFGGYQKCCCMNNNYWDDDNMKSDLLETQCSNAMCGCNNMYNNSCECGFGEEENVFPKNPSLGQSYVPYQFMDKTFKPAVGLKMGTIFPELVSPYMPGQSMAEIEYIRNTNKIGEGCNK